FMLGGLFVATAAVTFARLPREKIIAVDRQGFAGAIPTRAGAWAQADDAGFVLPPEDERAAASVYEDQLTRSYMSAAADAPVMLLIAYDRGQSGLLMIHRPESCYPGSGFQITDMRDVVVPLRPGLTANAKFLSTQRDARIEQVLYWTRLGNDFPSSWDEQRHDLALQNLRGQIPDGALVRMSMIDPDADKALATMRSFAATLYRAAPRNGRALLAGPANV
ncbi:MAG: EpsI family protein, partial [Sphingomonas sp.]